MALDYSKINQFPASSGDAIYMLITSLTSGSSHTAWTLTSSNRNDGAAVASGSSMNRPNAWAVVTDSGSRSFCFYKGGSGSDDGSWSIYYSRAAGFTGGGNGTRPTATDEAMCFGKSGANGSGNPDAQALFTASTGTYYFHAVTDANQFWFMAVEPGTSRSVGGGYYEQLLSNTYASEDQDPVMMCFKYGSRLNPQSPSDSSSFYSGAMLAEFGIDPQRDLGPFSVIPMTTIDNFFGDPSVKCGPMGWVRANLTGASFGGMPACALINSPLFMRNFLDLIGIEAVSFGQAEGTFPALVGGAPNVSALQNGDGLQLSLTNGQNQTETITVTLAAGDTIAAVAQKIRVAADGMLAVDVTAQGCLSFTVISTQFMGPNGILKIETPGGASATEKVGLTAGQFAKGAYSTPIVDAVATAFSNRLSTIKANPSADPLSLYSTLGINKMAGFTVTGLLRSLVAPRGGGTDPHNGKERPLPLIYGRNVYAPPAAIKGWSSLVNWATRQHRNGALVTITANSDVRVVFDDLMFPWKPDGTVPLV